jgi:predicted GNAT family N-acyltransferase
MPSLENQVYILSLLDQENQNLEDIRLGLLATLNEYRGFPSVKKLFEDAIKGVESKCPRRSERC